MKLCLGIVFSGECVCWGGGRRMVTLSWNYAPHEAYNLDIGSNNDLPRKVKTFYTMILFKRKNNLKLENLLVFRNPLKLRLMTFYTYKNA